MAVKRYGSGYSQRVPKQITGVYLAAYFGLSEVIMALLKHRYGPDVKDTYNRTPLSWAAGKGLKAVVKLLLANEGVDPNSNSGSLRWDDTVVGGAEGTRGSGEAAIDQGRRRLMEAIAIE
jgi:ankyrin repeat protein